MSGKSARARRKRAVPPVKSTQRPVQAPKGAGQPRSRLQLGGMTAVLVVAAIIGLYLLRSSSNSASAYPFAIGSPGPGQIAPPVRLPATTGSSFDLASYRGKAPVLLYFQEGLTCQPCWDQIKAIEKDLPKFRALGIGPIVSITTDLLDLITQKAKDEGFSIPVLSDPGGRVSDSYSARDYGMMGHDRDGHTFVLVGKDSRIVWRADYGGAPNYTMFVPVKVLLAQLTAGNKGGA